MIGALAVLGVTMASSMMSAAITDIRRAFPGYSSEMYIMSEYSTHLMQRLMRPILTRNSHIWIRTRLRGRSVNLGTLLRGFWSANNVLYHLLALHYLFGRFMWCKES